MDYVQFEEQRIDKAQELAGQQKKLAQGRAALAEAEKHYRALVSEFQQSKQAELSATETKAASLAQEVVKAEQRTDLQRLVFPIDGVVQQLAVHTLGGVVTPAQQLMIIISQDHLVEVEAQVENKDVGFVKEGQPVEIKVETFPFTLYGTIPGTVLSVSDDAAPWRTSAWCTRHGSAWTARRFRSTAGWSISRPAWPPRWRLRPAGGG